MTALAPSDLAAMVGVTHTAGIYADMTVDGPEIGTLVVIVDRAKNLPNRKTMGKQNPYCAARLGKEAKKTDTDKRGGQTPKWDQELRFTVHESPDYRNLKVSVFNDDKKTDLIGEMWVNLDEVVIPGGGKMDNWHQLHYKGKYAGEVMLELTYYDSRPDERGEQLRQKALEKKMVRRRPLPAADMHTTPLPHQMENTRTAGPRAMGSRPRIASAVPVPGPGPVPVPVAAASHPTAPPVQYPNHYAPVEEFEYHPGFQPLPLSLQPHRPAALQPQHQHHPEHYASQSAMPDLPELPPMSRGHRGSLPPQPRNMPPHAASYHGRSQSHPELPHSHSAPNTVPQAYDGTHHYPPQTRTPRMRAYDAPSLQPTVEDEMEDLPPLPPSHRMHGSQARSQSVDGFDGSPLPASHSTPDFRKSYSGPPSHSGYAPSSAGSSVYGRPSSSHRLPPHNSMPDVYATGTPPRAHPLTNEMRRSVSPAGFHHAQRGCDEPYQRGYPQDGALVIKPRAISPSPPPQPRNTLASIRHPVQTFAAQNSPSAVPPASEVSHSANRSVPQRKSVSPRPSTSGSSGGSVPFSPDDYGSFNPNASLSSRFTHSQSTNPHSPYHIPNSPRVGSEEPEPNRPLPNPDGPITTWDGRTVDPSDHLPVHSWAPEPEKKTPEKKYGAGAYDPNRPRGLSGPRHNIHNVPSSGGRVGRDVVVNIRTKHSPNPNTFESPPQHPVAGRNRLVKRSGAPSSPNLQSGPNPPLSEIAAPNPYASGHGYSNSFTDGYYEASGDYERRRYHSRSPAPQQQQQQRHYGDLFGGNYENTGSQYAGSEYGVAGGYGGRAYSEPPPDLPPKIPFDEHAYGVSALEKEMQRIDIGVSTRGTVARKSRWRG